MSADEDAKATQLVVAILNEPAIASIDFQFGGISVKPSMYAKVAKAIDEKKITIVVDGAHMDAKIGALYHNEIKLDGGKVIYDIITLRSPDLGSTVSEQFNTAGVIVHECTHAGFDLLKTRKMTHLVNEAVAYIAAAILMVAKMKEMRGHPERVTESILEPIANAAWQIAMLIVDGKKITKALTNSMSVALSNSDEYKNKLKKIVIHDGVGKPWKL